MLVILYHANCNDGFCAAWVMHQKFPDAKYIPVQYGQEPPKEVFEKDNDVVIVDFSYKRDVLQQIEAACKSIIVLDHHKTAQADLEGLDYCKFDMTKSGGRLAWEHLNGNTFIRPWLVDYTMDRDLWKHELPNTHEINAALSSYEFDFEIWDSLSTLRPNDLYKEGLSILRYKKQQVQVHLKPVMIGFPGFDSLIPSVNATTLFSDIAGELSKDYPFAAAWFRRQDGKYQFSLRSQPEGADVSEVAKLYGGGGHKHAAGFEIDKLWF